MAIVTSVKCILEALRHHVESVSLHPALEAIHAGARLKGNGLRVAIALPRGTTLAVIPKNSLLTTKRVVDDDNLGFSAHPDFLDGKEPSAVLAHHVSLQYWLGNTWYRYQLPFFEEAAASPLYAQFKSHFVTPPETWFLKALMYVRSTSIGNDENLSLIPVVDLLSRTTSEGNVVLNFGCCPSDCVDYPSLCRLKGRRKLAAKGTHEKYISVIASRDLDAMELLSLPRVVPFPRA